MVKKQWTEFVRCFFYGIELIRTIHFTIYKSVKDSGRNSYIVSSHCLNISSCGRSESIYESTDYLQVVMELVYFECKNQIALFLAKKQCQDLVWLH